METAELGGEYFVRALQEFSRSSERKLAELSYEKADLEVQVVTLTAALQAKDRVIREYLKRVALLEFALKRGNASTGEPAARAPALCTSTPLGETLQGASDVLRGYLRELDELQISLEDVAVEPAPPRAVHVVKPKTYKLTTSLSASLLGVNAVALMDAGRVVSGSEDGLVKLWAMEPVAPVLQNDLKLISTSVNTCTPNLVLRGHAGAVTALAATGGTVVSGGLDGCIIRHRISQLPDLFPSQAELSKCVTYQRITAHTGRVAALRPHGSLPVLASAGSDKQVMLWSQDGSQLAAFTCDSAAPAALTWGTGSKDLLAGLADGVICLYDVDAGKRVADAHLGFGINGLATIDALTVAALTGGNLMLLEDMETVAQVKCSATCVAASGSDIFTGHADGTVRIWDKRSLDTPTSTMTLGGYIRDIAISGSMLICGTSDGSVFVHRK